MTLQKSDAVGSHERETSMKKMTTECLRVNSTSYANHLTNSFKILWKMSYFCRPTVMFLVYFEGQKCVISGLVFRLCRKPDAANSGDVQYGCQQQRSGCEACMGRASCHDLYGGWLLPDCAVFKQAISVTGLPIIKLPDCICALACAGSSSLRFSTESHAPNLQLQ